MLYHDAVIKARVPQLFVEAVAAKARQDNTTSSALIRRALQRELESAR